MSFTTLTLPSGSKTRIESCRACGQLTTYSNPFVLTKAVFTYHSMDVLERLSLI